MDAYPEKTDTPRDQSRYDSARGEVEKHLSDMGDVIDALERRLAPISCSLIDSEVGLTAIREDSSQLVGWIDDIGNAVTARTDRLRRILTALDI